MDAPVSFWQLPDWIKVFYVAGMSAAFLGAVKVVPFVFGKIDDIMKNENRQSIFRYVHDNPGSTIAQVAQAQHIERATVKYHLYKLESDGKIILSRMGKYSRIFRNSHAYTDPEKQVIAHLQNTTGKSVLQLILENPGITNQELAERLDIEKSAVHWHINRFLTDGMIAYRPEGKFKRYFIQDNVRALLEKYLGPSV